eukprot:scaffold19162_cov118-Isochrysis_galbana.AAC.2
MQPNRTPTWPGEEPRRGAGLAALRRRPLSSLAAARPMACHSWCAPPPSLAPPRAAWPLAPPPSTGVAGGSGPPARGQARGTRLCDRAPLYSHTHRTSTHAGPCHPAPPQPPGRPGFRGPPRYRCHPAPPQPPGRPGFRAPPRYRCHPAPPPPPSLPGCRAPPRYRGLAGTARRAPADRVQPFRPPLRPPALGSSRRRLAPRTARWDTTPHTYMQRRDQQAVRPASPDARACLPRLPPAHCDPAPPYPSQAQARHCRRRCLNPVAGHSRTTDAKSSLSRPGLFLDQRSRADRAVARPPATRGGSGGASAAADEAGGGHGVPADLGSEDPLLGWTLPVGASPCCASPCCASPCCALPDFASPARMPPDRAMEGPSAHSVRGRALSSSNWLRSSALLGSPPRLRPTPDGHKDAPKLLARWRNCSALLSARGASTRPAVRAAAAAARASAVDRPHMAGSGAPPFRRTESTSVLFLHFAPRGEAYVQLFRKDPWRYAGSMRQPSAAAPGHSVLSTRSAGCSSARIQSVIQAILARRGAAGPSG